MPARETRQTWMGPLPAAPGCDCHICRPEARYADRLERGALDTVLQYGWQVMAISDEHRCSHPEHQSRPVRRPRETGLPFSYTVGLGHRAGHPELLMSGLDPRVMHVALNDVAERILQGRRLSPGDEVEGVLAGVPVAIERVSEKAVRRLVTWSGWFHRRPPEALAVVWPDRLGVFAWQPGAPQELDERQPRDWREPIEHTGGLAADPAWAFPVPPDRLARCCLHVADDGAPVLWVAREPGRERVEEWSIHCGADSHHDGDVVALPLGDLVRAAPSLRFVSDIGLGEQAWRHDPDSAWTTSRQDRRWS